MTKQITFICLLHFTLQVGMAMAQESTVSTDRNDAIGISIGTHLGYLRDQNFSPLNYHENGLTLSMFYEHLSTNGKRLLSARLDYTSGNMRSDADAWFTAPSYEGNLDVSLLFRVKQNDRRLSLFAGPQGNMFVYYLQWMDIGEAWSYCMVQGLNIKALVNYSWSDKRTLRTSLSIPLIGNLVRPPYNGFDQFIVEHQEEVIILSFRGKFASFSDYVGVDWRTSYQYDLSPRLALQADYLFRYQRATRETEFVRFQNQFTGSIVMKF